MADSASNQKGPEQAMKSVLPPEELVAAEPFVEVAVLIPLRGKQVLGTNQRFKFFTYSVPPLLRGQLRPGHLVAVPFGQRRAQGVVMGTLHETKVKGLRDVDRLIHSAPVLWPLQLELARWMASYYVAPFSSCLTLFAPAGVITRSGGKGIARPLYEWRICLQIEPAEIAICLSKKGRDTHQKKVWDYLLANPHLCVGRNELLQACNLPAASGAIRALQQKGWLKVEGAEIKLGLELHEARLKSLALGGTSRYLYSLQMLAKQGGEAWKSELDALCKTPLKDWRWLADHGLIKLQEMQRLRNPIQSQAFPPSNALQLSRAQKLALDVMRERLYRKDGAPGQTVLLQGITGSGKTEVYLQALEICLAQGRQAIVLVPEISLTPQTVKRFAGRFPGRVSFVHSGLSTGERFDIYRLAHAGAIDVLVGPRSALFAPMARIGLIVLDEEHDDAFKQSAEEWGANSVFYDARRVAAEMSRRSGALLILGSATPSLGTLANVFRGKITRTILPERIGQTVKGFGALPLPPIELVDMRQELMAGNSSVFSRSLQEQLALVLSQGEQAILLMNRRGSRTFVLCRNCGHVLRCADCSICLTYHQDSQQLECHSCGQKDSPPRTCPDCQDKRIRYFGAGTELVTDELAKLLPAARILRWDADTARGKDNHIRFMKLVSSGQVDVIVGTQMIAKGLDLPLVTLVGVIAADTGLFMPDFRAPERTCQLLIQVAGRAGRSARGGRVLFQTYQPEHYAIQAAVQNDYERFCRRELQFREEMGYPPHRRMARLVYWDKDANKARKAGQSLKRAIRRELHRMGPQASQLEVLGPTAPFYERLRTYWRQQILILGHDPTRLLHKLEIPSGWRVDLDPVSTL